MDPLNLTTQLNSSQPSVWTGTRAICLQWPHPFIDPSIHPEIHPSIYPYIYPFILSSIHPFILSSYHASFFSYFSFLSLQLFIPISSIFISFDSSFHPSSLFSSFPLFILPSIHPSFLQLSLSSFSLSSFLPPNHSSTFLPFYSSLAF